MSVFRKCHLLAAGVVLAISTISAQAAVSVSQSEDAQKLIIMQNQFIRMVIDPTHGGSVISFVYKPNGLDVIPPERGKRSMGLFMDHYWGGGWPGEIMDGAFDVAATDTGADEAGVRMRYTMAGKWNGQTFPKVQGLVFEKTFSLRRGCEAVFCHIAISNPTTETKAITYWLQNYLLVGGKEDPKQDICSRPSSRGVARWDYGVGVDYFLNADYAGWSAATDTAGDTGFVWLMDYDYVNRFYNWQRNRTLEWLYARTLIPAGGKWETDVILLPTDGIRRISHASREIVAGLGVRREEKTIILTHTLKSGLAPVKGLALNVEVLNAANKKDRIVTKLDVGVLTSKVKTIHQKISGAPDDPLVIRVTAMGKSGKSDFVHKYWDFYAGGYGYGANVSQDLVTPLHVETGPRKKPILMKPKVIKRIPGPVAYYWMKGLSLGSYRLDESLHLAGAPPAPEGRTVVGRYAAQSYGEGATITRFPYDYDELMKYEAVIADNVNIQCTGTLGKEMLYDYLTHGGGLLILGGKTAYGAGGWAGLALKELLPIKPSANSFDVEKTDGGRLEAGENHWIAEGMNLHDGPWAAYVHRCEVKHGAKVLLVAADRPFLVVWEHDGARVACMLGTPYGDSAAADGPLFFDWKEWPQLVARTLQWLGHRETE